MKSYLYHIRHEAWQGLYWQVNTSRKETSRIKGGTFGSDDLLNVKVGVTR